MCQDNVTLYLHFTCTAAHQAKSCFTRIRVKDNCELDSTWTHKLITCQIWSNVFTQHKAMQHTADVINSLGQAHSLSLTQAHQLSWHQTCWDSHKKHPKVQYFISISYRLNSAEEDNIPQCHRSVTFVSSTKRVLTSLFPNPIATKGDKSYCTGEMYRYQQKVDTAGLHSTVKNNACCLLLTRIVLYCKIWNPTPHALQVYFNTLLIGQSSNRPQRPGKSAQSMSSPVTHSCCFCWLCTRRIQDHQALVVEAANHGLQGWWWSRLAWWRSRGTITLEGICVKEANMHRILLSIGKHRRASLAYSQRGTLHKHF